jgi:hypothetical protein
MVFFCCRQLSLALSYARMLVNVRILLISEATGQFLVTGTQVIFHNDTK